MMMIEIKVSPVSLPENPHPKTMIRTPIFRTLSIIVAEVIRRGGAHGAVRGGVEGQKSKDNWSKIAVTTAACRTVAYEVELHRMNRAWSRCTQLDAGALAREREMCAHYEG